MSANIPEEQNCSLWITNLPRYCDDAMLLGAVRNCAPVGKVWQTVLNPPQPGSAHAGYAAKLVFFQPHSAARLIRLSREGRFTVGDSYPVVTYNRTQVARQADRQASRVLKISGPAGIVNRAYLTGLFDSYSNYTLESVQERDLVGGPDGLREMTWRFGSYRCQAQWCYSKLRATRTGYMRQYGVGEGGAAVAGGNIGHQWRRVQVHWGVDPCA